MKKSIFTFALIFIATITFAQKKHKNNRLDFVGKTYDYTIEETHLNLTIISNTEAKWLYVSSPNNETGKTETEKATITKIAKGVYQITWTEKDGSNVIDIFNLNTNEVFVNFTLPDAKMYNLKANFKIK